ncbi:hypothetical protein [Jannaschia sp. LMIT008]|uniref:hypothetical protein n=1 Tax=Jannaschia maritima TaxID=3032585 RepID=UPI00281258E9|nr:hypothetical protein [Jannaschia sp. LMIT008]
MIDYQRLNRDNLLVALAVRSCIGAISSNMRMISFAQDGDRIDMFFDLRHDVEEDREEAADMADELAILTERFRVVPHICIVGDVHLAVPGPDRFVIHKQRQPDHPG